MQSPLLASLIPVHLLDLDFTLLHGAFAEDEHQVKKRGQVLVPHRGHQLDLSEFCLCGGVDFWFLIF